MRPKILIVGAGPVGLLLANLLADEGVETIVVEKRSEATGHSKAIGITPPSLEILARLELDQAFISGGVRISRAVVHGKGSVVGDLSFASIPGPYPFILSFPQARTEELLRQRLEGLGSVELLFSTELTGLVQTAEGVSAELRRVEDGIERVENLQADYLCACDGFRSTARSLLNLPLRGRTAPETFLMADFTDRSGLQNEAHLFFTADGSVESFPLPGGIRRWVVQTEEYLEQPPRGYLEELVERRSGFSLLSDDKGWESPFRIHSRIMPSFVAGRVVFAGDAAHTIPPIGGQGMNTGLADAERLAAMLIRGSDLRHYDSARRRAAKAAAYRSMLSMRVGTVGGGVGSALRNAAIRLALATPLKRSLAAHYAMLSIPYRNLQASPL